MLFLKNKFIKEEKTSMTIKIFENETDIIIRENNSIENSSINKIKCGYNDVIHSSYESAKLSCLNKDISLDEYLNKHSNMLRQDISNFIKHIEFKILCGPPLPFKIDKIYFECNGPELFEKEFKSKFSFYDK